MRVLQNVELCTVAGGEVQVTGGSDYAYGAELGGGGGGITTGEFARMDGASYRSEPVDYCGNTTLNAPESIARVYQGEACRVHDACYADAQVSRLTCDVQFLVNMVKNCDTNVLCLLGAVVYYDAVRIGGGMSYGTPIQ